MAFNSLQFLLLFLPLCVLGVAVLSRKRQTAVPVYLLLASWLYYASFRPINLIVLLLSISFNYALGRNLAGQTLRHRGIWFFVGVLGNVALLGTCKYAGVFSQTPSSLDATGSGASGWLVPVGVSFYTFTQIAYLVDAYSSDLVERGLARYALFVSFFPYITAGPILRYAEIHSRFSSPVFGTLSEERLARGMSLVAVGLFKKVCLAAGMANLADPVFNAAGLGIRIPCWESIVGAVAYSFQIYFDFGGYSDIAVGLGWVFGLSLPWNFNSPYKALNIADFWQRWHISLSQWLRAFIFTPVTFSLVRAGRRAPFAPRGSDTWAYMAGTLVTMFVCGVWHGAGWTFIVWGLMHGLYLIANQLAGIFTPAAGRRRVPGGDDAESSTIRTWARRGATFAAVTVAWIAFRSPSLDGAGKLWWAMLGGNGGFLPNRFRGFLGAAESHGFVANAIFSQTSVFAERYSAIHIAGWMIAAAVLIWGFPNTRDWMEGTVDRPGAAGWSKLAETAGLAKWRPDLRTALVVCSLFIYSIMTLRGKSEFLYFRF